MNAEGEYNLEKLRARMEKIEHTLLGLNVPVEKVVGTENGIMTEKKIQEFADALISRQCFLYGYYVGIPGHLRRYIELFCYLVFRANDYENHIIDFADFLEETKKMQGAYKTKEELLMREANFMSGPIGFFRKIHESCLILTGRTPADDYSEEEMREMIETYNDKTSASSRREKKNKELFEMSKREKKQMWKKYEDYMIEGDMDYFDALREEEFRKFGVPGIEEEEEQEELPLTVSEGGKEPVFFRNLDRLRHREYYEEKANAWKNTFENPEEYLNAYREFIDLYFCMENFSFENMVLEVLAQKGFNKAENDEKFLELYAELNRALRIAGRII